MTETTHLTYVGPPGLVGDLAQALEDGGIAVDYRPPFETKDLATAMAAVSVVLAATGSVPDVVDRVRDWVGRRPGTRVEGLPEPPGQGSVKQRLAEIDRLLECGALTQRERDRERRRVLSEL